MKFNWRQAVSVGFGFMAIFLIWPIYNQFVPILLQAGHPQWEAESQLASQSITGLRGFGLPATLAFFIMTWDNIINIFVQSWVGAKSDRTRTRWGRRKPWLLVGVPVAAVGFMLIPFVQTLLAILFFIVVTNLGMALFRAPTAALLGDLFLPEQRSKARGIMVTMASIGGIFALIVGSLLFERSGRAAPFIFAAILMVASATAVLIFVREPQANEGETLAPNSTVRQALSSLWQTEDHSGIWLLLAIGLSYLVFESLQAGVSSIGVFVLGLPLGQTVRFASITAFALIFAAYPSSLLAGRFGRQRTISAGLVGLILLAGSSYFLVRNPLSFAVSLAIFGFLMSLVVVNDLPLLFDMGGGNQIGAITGVFFVATQSAAILGPTLAGFTIDVAGNHRMVFAFAAVCAFLAWLVLRQVRVEPNFGEI